MSVSQIELGLLKSGSLRQTLSKRISISPKSLDDFCPILAVWFSFGAYFLYDKGLGGGPGLYA